MISSLIIGLLIESSLSDCLQGVFRVVSDIFNDFYEFGEESARISMFGVCEPQNASCLMVVQIFPNINGVMGAVNDELVSHPPGNFVFRICFLVPQLDILESSDRDSHFLRIIPFLVLLASILPLVCEGVALASPLDLVFAPLLVLVSQEDLFDLCLLDFQFFWNNS